MGAGCSQINLPSSSRTQDSGWQKKDVSGTLTDVLDDDIDKVDLQGADLINVDELDADEITVSTTTISGGIILPLNLNYTSAGLAALTPTAGVTLTYTGTSTDDALGIPVGFSNIWTANGSPAGYGIGWVSSAWGTDIASLDKELKFQSLSFTTSTGQDITLEASSAGGGSNASGGIIRLAPGAGDGSGSTGYVKVSKDGTYAPDYVLDGPSSLAAEDNLIAGKAIVAENGNVILRTSTAHLYSTPGASASPVTTDLYINATSSPTYDGAGGKVYIYGAGTTSSTAQGYVVIGDTIPSPMISGLPAILGRNSLVVGGISWFNKTTYWGNNVASITNGGTISGTDFSAQGTITINSPTGKLTSTVGRNIKITPSTYNGVSGKVEFFSDLSFGGGDTFDRAATTTLSTATTTLWTSGAVSDNTMWFVEAQVTCMTTDGASRAYYRYNGSFFRDGTNIAQLGGATSTFSLGEVESDSTWDSDFQTDTGAQTFGIYVKATTDTNCKALVHETQVTSS
jgi:hypothetical protein